MVTYSDNIDALETRYAEQLRYLRGLGIEPEIAGIGGSDTAIVAKAGEGRRLMATNGYGTLVGPLEEQRGEVAGQWLIAIYDDGEGLPVVQAESKDFETAYLEATAAPAAGKSGA